MCPMKWVNIKGGWYQGAGFKTAFVRRPGEWGAAGPPDPEPNPAHDIIVDGFPDLAAALGVAL